MVTPHPPAKLQTATIPSLQNPHPSHPSSKNKNPIPPQSQHLHLAMSAQQPEETEETYLPSASGVQDFYPPLDKDFPLPAKDTTETMSRRNPFLHRRRSPPPLLSQRRRLSRYARRRPSLPRPLPLRARRSLLLSSLLLLRWPHLSG
jgi:hypothetical protein